MNKQKILLVDDDIYFLDIMNVMLSDEGFNVVTANNISEAKVKIEENKDTAFILVDIMMPSGEESNLETQMGYKSGIVLARWIKQNYPEIEIIGMSGYSSLDVKGWFEKHEIPFFEKGSGALAEILEILQSKMGLNSIKSFIVHGHDETAKYELKNYLQNTLKLPEPIILHEQPSLGRTIIEKFEDVTNKIDFVFVILTPDDAVYDSKTSDDLKRRARQNVIFEMGYFYSKLQRRKGKIVLLYKDQLELPTDISGIIYIDISNGIDAAGETIRKEILPIIQNK
jgi:CheY-like chemotaxis protein